MEEAEESQAVVRWEQAPARYMLGLPGSALAQAELSGEATAAVLLGEHCSARFAAKRLLGEVFSAGGIRMSTSAFPSQPQLAASCLVLHRL